MSVMNDGNYYNNTRLGGLHNMESNNNYNNGYSDIDFKKKINKKIWEIIEYIEFNDIY